ncbi:hypothetical protein [Rhodococcus wratislaviensis]|uniref:hypothetical protein n=1 Tax=Rhodococcus wratislaviensis TaxID=44752 RepID=UPI0020D05D92|nr:hypothetical protein [Rhodococcus wratislaviensis]
MGASAGDQRLVTQPIDDERRQRLEIGCRDHDDEIAATGRVIDGADNFVVDVQPCGLSSLPLHTFDLHDRRSGNDRRCPLIHARPSSAILAQSAGERDRIGSQSAAQVGPRGPRFELQSMYQP